MTAEIAVLNRSAVALAADSAGTIGQGGGAKIYNAFNKIFELSEYEPVAIMINGNLDFAGLPLEALIKRYRRNLGRKNFPHVRDYMNDFLGFLSAEVPRSDEADNRTAFQIVYDYFGPLLDRMQQRIFDDIAERGKYLGSKVNSIIEEVLAAEMLRMNAAAPLPEFRSSMPKGGDERWLPVINQALDQRFRRYPNLSKANRRKLQRCAKFALLKGPLSSFATGIVVAGFGADEFCPSLCAVQIDGVVLDRLKFIRTDEVDIGRESTQADMLGFAQQDMVATFLNGVDPRYESYIDEALSTLFGSIIEQIEGLAAAASTPPAVTPSATVAIHRFFEHVRGQLTEKLLEFRNQSFKAPIIEMIRFMPAQELATLAASMIEITSLKRRVTTERETVGGDVDVAVISKAEGFVWIKRKHYFPPDINPRFFRRLDGRYGGDGERAR